jgi:hypothetical protein
MEDKDSPFNSKRQKCGGEKTENEKRTAPKENARSS